MVTGIPPYFPKKLKITALVIANTLDASISRNQSESLADWRFAQCGDNRENLSGNSEEVEVAGRRHSESASTEGLTNGVDSVVLGHLMGRQDASPVARTYQHLAREQKFLGEQARYSSWSDPISNSRWWRSLQR